MIKFIQKYQKFFYAIVTTVIVISFSFFGTYGAMDASSIHEQIAFTALDGKKITRGELEEMVLFLQTDVLDKSLYGAAWGPNFLNDGVIRKDFLETGMGTQLAEAYPDLLRAELDARLQREKRFTPYTHPKASYISAPMVWGYFAPSIKQNLDRLQASTNPLNPQAFQARVDLYLAERAFPAPFLGQVLSRQEAQYGTVEKDQNLPFRDLSLFGYHTVDDWFGPKFLRLVSEFIFNSAIVAEQKGYKVTKEEAWADLVQNASTSFKDVSRYPDMNLASQSEYLNEQLRRMGMDNVKATKIWQKVLMFRRLFHDVANAQMIEPQTLALNNSWSTETVQGDYYRLPKALRFSDMMDLAEFELYLSLTSKESASLLPPEAPLAAAEIAKKSPELVEKRYLAVIKQADLKALETHVSMKETLDWEIEPVNFAMLKKEFSDLGIKKGDTLDERMEALDSLPNTVRNKVDAFARHQIAILRPEAVDQALNYAKADAQELRIRLKGGKDPLAGVKDRNALINVLDKTPLDQEVRFPVENYVYVIKVIDRSPSLEVVTFEEAKASGVLSDLLTKTLEPFYTEVRGQHEDKFKKDGSWKSLGESKRAIAEIWLDKKIKAIKADADKSLKDKTPSNMIPDIAASLRFTGYADKVKGSPVKDSFVKEVSTTEADSNKLASKLPWANQFKWDKEEKKVSRGLHDEIFEKEKLFTLNKGDSSPILTPPNGDLSFLVIKDRKAENDGKLLAQQTVGIRNVIGMEAERDYMKQILALIKDKGAISFDYMQNDNLEEMGQ